MGLMIFARVLIASNLDFHVFVKYIKVTSDEIDALVAFFELLPEELDDSHSKNTNNMNER